MFKILIFDKFELMDFRLFLILVVINNVPLNHYFLSKFGIN